MSFSGDGLRREVSRGSDTYVPASCHTETDPLEVTVPERWLNNSFPKYDTKPVRMNARA